MRLARGRPTSDAAAVSSRARVVTGPVVADRGLVAVSGSVSWDDAAKDELYVAVEARHGRLLGASPESLLLGVLPAASSRGTAAIQVDKPVDPLLLDGLEVIQEYHRIWYGLPPVAVEATPARAAVAGPRGTGLFMSGGVDSMASLWRNLRRYPVGHPGRVTYALFVDFVGPAHLADLDGQHRRATTQRAGWLTGAMAEMGVTLVPVVTNFRVLDGYEFGTDWTRHSHGTLLAAVAHAFGPALSRVLIASSYWAGRLEPWGSHPLTDPRASTSSMTITHDNEQARRLDKLRQLVDWPAGLALLDVCSFWRERERPDVNCGRCEKCQRTMASLVAVGVEPSGLASFAGLDVSPGTIAAINRLGSNGLRGAWGDIQDQLPAERHALRRAVALLLARDRVATPLQRRLGRRALAVAKYVRGRTVAQRAGRRGVQDR
ncbi:MAG: hypothetical protein QOJ90_675 [Actinomycetota bacterium]|jgi:hypothetical protein|nr:hypothetical protein [Actinomycetota bacterium]